MNTPNNALALSSDHWLSPHTPDDQWRRAFVFWLDSFPSKRTQRVYHEIWMVFDSITSKHPGEIEAEDVRIWKGMMTRQLEPNLSAATINLRLSAISSFYRFVNQHYAFLRDDNPCEGIKRLPVNPYGKSTYLVEDQDVRLLAQVDRSTDIGKRDYAIILLFLTLGVRLDAVQSATMDSLRAVGDVMYLTYRNKGGDEITRRIPNNAARALADWLQARGLHEGSLFGVTRRMIQHMVLTYCNRAFGKGHGITVHSLRHTAAMNADDAGAKFSEINRLLDHKSARVTAIYLDHIKKGNADNMSAKLDERYGS